VIGVAIRKSRTIKGTKSPSMMNTPHLNPSQRPVLDLPPPEGWKAEFTYTEMVNPPTVVTHPSCLTVPPVSSQNDLSYDHGIPKGT